MAYKRINQIYFLADAVDDLTTISTEIAPEDPMGLECYVITEACEYKALSTGEWIKQVIGGNTESTPANYITEEELKNAIEQIEIPSVTGLASEEYVNEAIFNTEEYVDVKVAEILSNPIFKTFEDTAISPENNQFGIYLEAKENKTLIEAMMEKGLGLYNFWVGKGAPGLPAKVLEKNASCRGICCVDVFRSETNWYGWIIMFDHDSDMYVQYIRNAVPTGWKYVNTNPAVAIVDCSAYGLTFTNGATGDVTIFDEIDSAHKKGQVCYLKGKYAFEGDLEASISGYEYDQGVLTGVCVCGASVEAKTGNMISINGVIVKVNDTAVCYMTTSTVGSVL